MFDTLPGFREFLPEACSVRNAIFDTWRQTAARFNFVEYDAPLLEPLELYIEKSGPEIVSQLFNFEDRGGRAVALRPEMTPSLARLVGARANAMRRPIKWFSIGENYRYERPQKGRTRAFYQLNADILGDSSPGADAELIALLITSLKRFGLTENDFYIRLSDRGLWTSFLEVRGLEESAYFEVLGVIDKLERNSREESLNSLSAIVGEGSASDLLDSIETMIGLKDFSDIKDYIETAFPESSASEKVSKRLDDWRIVFENLESLGCQEFVEVDLGIVRGLAYYTGFVFEAFERSGESRALAGGGRYDTLVKKMGGPDLPAAGFAMGDVTLSDCLSEKGLIGPHLPEPDAYMVIGDSTGMKTCLADVARLRQQGLSIEYPYKLQSFGKQFKNAEKSGARFAVVYGEDEIKSGMLTIKDLKNGESHSVPQIGLLEWLMKAR
ncbi:MAG: histidine--tRNA ligase [Verrucomicrobiota bacterium]